MPLSATSTDRAPRLASETARGPALIIASPGPYQTITLVEQVVDLIQNHGAAPESLLVVTRADNTAREFTIRIRNRLNSLGIKINPHGMYAGTFHALCLRLLDEHRGLTRMRRNYTVMDPFDQHYFLYQRLNDYRAIANSKLVMGQDDSCWNQSQQLLKRLNALTEQALDPEHLAAASDEGSALLACHTLYLQQLKKANALDFSTIQLEVLRLLQNNPDLLAALRSQLAYLMVDGHRQVNTIQERIFRCLVNEEGQSSCLAGNEVDELQPQYGDGIKPVARAPQGETVPWWLM